MPIKSLDELLKIRENSMKKVNLRESGEDAEAITEVLVGMATCGIAAGAREALDEILASIEKNDLQNVRVIQVGCLGYCHSEPTVQVNRPGHEPVLYGNVDREVAKEIVEKHIIGGNMLEDNVLVQTFNKA